MKSLPWLVLLSLSLIGCSGSKSAQTVDQETPQVELSDADEFVENPNEEPVEVANEATEPVVAEEPAATEEPTATEEPVVAESPVVDNSIDPTEQDAAPVVSNEIQGSSEKVYKVQKNETLMMIAFKLYGDYGKWKEIANYNSDKLNGSTSLKEGMELKYMAPAEEFVWNPEGLPYLIRTGDTLGGISNNVYQTRKKWKLIWDNNRPLIKDPNKIFAGFTLYYLENGRDVAAQM